MTKIPLCANLLRSDAASSALTYQISLIARPLAENSVGPYFEDRLMEAVLVD